MYYKILATSFIVLFATWVIGAVLGSRRVEKASVVGLILLVTTAALMWVLTGVPPVPHWMARTVARLFQR